MVVLLTVLATIRPSFEWRSSGSFVNGSRTFAFSVRVCVYANMAALTSPSEKCFILWIIYVLQSAGNDAIKCVVEMNNRGWLRGGRLISLYRNVGPVCFLKLMLLFLRIAGTMSAICFVIYNWRLLCVTVWVFIVICFEIMTKDL